MRLKHRTALLIAAGYLLLAYVVYINFVCECAPPIAPTKGLYGEAD